MFDLFVYSNKSLILMLYLRHNFKNLEFSGLCLFPHALVNEDGIGYEDSSNQHSWISMCE